MPTPIVTNTDARDFLGLSADDPLIATIRPGVERACVKLIGWEPVRTSYTRYWPQGAGGGGEADEFVIDYGGVANVGGTTDRVILDHKYVLASGLQVWEYSGAYAGQYTGTSWDSLTVGTEYYLDLFDANVSRSGHVVRLGADWPSSAGSVKVTYTAGFTQTELSGAMTGSTDYTDASDLKLGVLIAIAKAWNEMMEQRQNSQGVSGPFTSESIEGYSYSKGAAGEGNVALVRALPAETHELLHPYRRMVLV